ncbi:unnamed protein product [Spirodela intermedia]|uniref:AAA+ ATPase domain-containing protein n=1 Tax=Spirodela intermedia TaxID=51605 RepID=A0A7I8IRG7_SPIIN|nr:unnamed protein product [Spirodela intermedia]CAA6660156.1 unnamed protein product [Spirodela intermedia]
MPSSKGKKSSKARLQERPPTRAIRTATPPAHGTQGSEDVEDEGRSRKLLSEAAAKFPGLISETAFLGRIADVCSSWEQEGGGANVWLSENAMVAASLRPGSLVSVSLVASGKQLSGEFPLDSLADGCAEYFGLDAVDSLTNEAGRYFAVAKVFSSQKVLKNGVRLSWSLSCTMGFPAAGRILFVSPIGNLHTSYIVHGTDNMDSSINVNDASVSSCISRDLYLKLVRENDGRTGYNERSSPVCVMKNSSFIPSREVSPPKTPSCYQPRISSPGSTPMLPKGSQDDVSGFQYPPNIGQSAIREGFKDEKCNELLLTYAIRWFRGRYLLKGNVLALPIFGQLCIFQVEGSIKESVDNDIAKQGRIYGKVNNLVVPEAKSPDVLSHNVFLVDYRTKIHLTPMPAVIDISGKGDMISSKLVDKNVRFKDSGNFPRVGGLSKEYALLKEIIGFSFSHQSSLLRVLLYGPPGTGKTSLACSCARDAGANLFVINGPEIVSEYYGESELKLLEVFDTARLATPAVVFIDELDAIAPARKDGGEGLSRRIVATLLELMDGIIRSDGILVIAATNRPESIEPALRRPGRLDKEIEIGVPTPDQRLDILFGILDGMHHDLSYEEIQSLALATHGFVGADLSALCNEAAMIALRRYVKNKGLCLKREEHEGEPEGCDLGYNNMHSVKQMDSVLLSLSKMAISSNYPSDHAEVSKDIDSEHYGILSNTNATKELSDLQITTEDFDQAKLKVRPSAMREVMLEVPKVRWEDVGGQNDVKRQLIEAVQWPQTCPDAFKRIGIRPPRGLLIFGPPGCSKTLMARAVASEAKLNFIAVKGPELLSKWVGESEKAISSLFSKARANSPSIIFFDEIDGLATTRGQETDGTSVGERVMNQLLIELDGLDERFGVTVIAATNRPDKIDPALLRPGRFDRHLDVKPPDEHDREDIFLIHMRDMPISCNVTARELACLTKGYSGADIKLVCREAAVAALEESFDISEISMEHFKVAIGRVKPADVQFYLDIAEKFRRFVDVDFEQKP